MSPDARIEREARAAGDVNSGRLVPAAGALLGAAIAVELGAEGAGARIATLAAASFAQRGDPGATLREVAGQVGAMALPVLGGAFLGALVAGLVQTKAFFGRSGRADPPERATPHAALSLLGWAALALLSIDLLRGAGRLLVNAESMSVARAGVLLARAASRALLVGVAALAAADHLIRARRRRARLAADALPRSAAARPPGGEEPTIMQLLAGAERVLFDGQVAVTFGRRDGSWWAFARGQGLSARALVDAARRARLPVRASAAATLETLALGAPLPPTQIAALALEGGV